jgi:flagellin
MALSLLTNTASLEAQRNLNMTSKALASNYAKLSSGQRINSASDDAAGLAISDRMKSQISSMGQAQRNANDGISMLQTADSALNQNSSVLSRMRDLAMQSANGTLGDSDRAALQTEFGQLTAEIDRISKVTQFNSSNLLDNNNQIKFQVGISSTASDTITATMQKMTATEYGQDAAGTPIDLSTLSIGNGKDYAGADITGDATTATNALDQIDKAIAATSSQRAQLGAKQNRLQVTVANLASAASNLSSANSQIRDVDVANETASMTRNNILSQAGLAVLAQANQLPSAALKLLQG